MAAQTWVQCDHCNKWRRLGLTCSKEELPEKWYCRFGHRRCQDPEDLFQETEERIVNSSSTRRRTNKGKEKGKGKLGGASNTTTTTSSSSKILIKEEEKKEEEKDDNNDDNEFLLLSTKVGINKRKFLYDDDDDKERKQRRKKEKETPTREGEEEREEEEEEEEEEEREDTTTRSSYERRRTLLTSSSSSSSSSLPCLVRCPLGCSSWGGGTTPANALAALRTNGQDVCLVECSPCYQSEDPLITTTADWLVDRRPVMPFVLPSPIDRPAGYIQSDFNRDIELDYLLTTQEGDQKASSDQNDDDDDNNTHLITRLFYTPNATFYRWKPFCPYTYPCPLDDPHVFVHNLLPSPSKTRRTTTTTTTTTPMMMIGEETHPVVLSQELLNQLTAPLPHAVASAAKSAAKSSSRPITSCSSALSRPTTSCLQNKIDTKHMLDPTEENPIPPAGAPPGSPSLSPLQPYLPPLLSAPYIRCCLDETSQGIFVCAPEDVPDPMGPRPPGRPGGGGAAALPRSPDQSKKIQMFKRLSEDEQWNNWWMTTAAS